MCGYNERQNAGDFFLKNVGLSICDSFPWLPDRPRRKNTHGMTFLRSGANMLGILQSLVGLDIG